MNDKAKQRELPFPQTKEDIRLATIERLWGDHPKVKTAAKMFTEENQRLAEQEAKGARGSPPTPFWVLLDGPPRGLRSRRSKDFYVRGIFFSR